LDEGRVGKAAQLLGRYPRLSGEVVVGAERGRNLGFPTANVEVRPERAVPANGVYAVYAVLGSERYPAVANIGVRPSFDNGQKTVEVHILDFDQDIYGCDLVIEFVARLRDERRFEDIDDLIAQIGADVQAARRILGDREGPAAEETPCPHRYHEVEHTADRALWVWGRTPANLFAGAAEGMYRLMADVDGLVATDWRQVRLEALDQEGLLVDWLNELLFLTETEGLVFVAFVVEALEDTGAAPGASLVAQVGGVPGSVTKAQIKAATFHNLALAQENDGWATLITFDV
jgi:SHS2 domain-containing protein